jgi:hypothetical protein
VTPPGQIFFWKLTLEVVKGLNKEFGFEQYTETFRSIIGKNF